MIKAFGTAYRFHPLFVLLMVLSLVMGHFVELITLFGIVLVHELGHVAAARFYGWRVKEVQLLPFGGVAVVEESSNVSAREELVVALAGPLQNVWMIGFGFAMKLLGWTTPGGWWDYFIECNLLIALFNLLPILPLDGGKVMQSLLSYAMSFHRALFWSLSVSLFLSAVMISGSLFQLGGGGVQLNVLFIGLFLFYTNWYGYRDLPYQFVRFLIGREMRSSVHIRRGTAAQPIVVGRSNRVGDVLQLLMRERYHLIYVVSDNGTIERVVPEQRIIQSFFSSEGNMTMDAIPS